MFSIRQQLFALQDGTYRNFHARLIPTVAYERIIGVRTPALRTLAKTIRQQSVCNDFLHTLPHDFYDENQLHALLINEMRDTAECLGALETFLPYVDNWATCDQLNPLAFRKMAKEGTLIAMARHWIAQPQPYTVRFGVNVLMRYYLDDGRFQPDYLQWVADIAYRPVADAPETGYYVRMVIAWFFATALAKQYEATIPYIAQQRLPDWVHRKTIQKAVESYRLSAEKKALLRTYR